MIVVPPRWGGFLLAVVVQGLPPLAIIERPLGAKTKRRKLTGQACQKDLPDPSDTPCDQNRLFVWIVMLRFVGVLVSTGCSWRAEQRELPGGLLWLNRFPFTQPNSNPWLKYLPCRKPPGSSRCSARQYQPMAPCAARPAVELNRSRVVSRFILTGVLNRPPKKPCLLVSNKGKPCKSPDPGNRGSSGARRRPHTTSAEACRGQTRGHSPA